MEKLGNYIKGEWIFGQGEGQELFNAVNGDKMAIADSSGIDMEGALHYARTVGSAKLSQMTFHERARAMKKLALHLLSKKDQFYQCSFKTGATKIDSWIDIEGGIGNLFVMSSKGRREMPALSYCLDGRPEILGKEGTFMGHHIYVPKEGVAIHINAFNFPVWGMLEKLAVNWLAGVPAIVKPATITSYLTELVVREIISSEILPQGALQLICGSAQDLLDHVRMNDVVTFTGSSHTGKMLKTHPAIIEHSVPFNMEADSLNCSVLGPDVTPSSPDFNIFIKEVAKEVTVKAGQKCTAIRRTIVPEHLIDAVSEALKERLSKTVVGDPQVEGVRMGPLAGMAQVKEVRERVAELKNECELLYGGSEQFEIMGGCREKGAFFPPTLLLSKNPMKDKAVHCTEAFGPVTTLIPYKNIEEAIILAKKGGGSLAGSVITSNQNIAKDFVLGTATSHGRVLVLNESCAKESTGHGSPMPQLIHGGPGRAGGGEEMGGIRGVFHYMQRTAIQGHPSMITAIGEAYQPGGQQRTCSEHPFKKYFEELSIGETLTTKSREITKEVIDEFAELSGDHFYAHKSDSDFTDTLFESQVAHGYFIISAAAGLFVHAPKGPVLANYGIDEFRFIKPAYVGSTISVRLTVKEKIDQENRVEEAPRGVVKWLVDVFDETGETVALGTILTLVKKKLS